MRILCTMPGKHGDSLWAMPTVRAIAQVHGPVDLIMSPAYSGILGLYRTQAYIKRAESWPSWRVQNTAPMTPWSPFEETLHHEALDLDPNVYDAIVHLGYHEWPDRPLPFCIYEQTRRIWPHVEMAPISLDPWIIPAQAPQGPRFVTAFSDEYFELKYGLTMLMPWPSAHGVFYGRDTRWDHEGSVGVWCDWETLATVMYTAKVVLACCSAPHVLAVAVGTSVVCMEPNEQRWNPIFWPLGQDGPRVTLVKGNDGKPTFDARHVRDAVRVHIAL